MSLQKRKLVLIGVLALIVCMVALLFTPGTRLLKTVNSHSYQYSYFPWRGIKASEVQNRQEAVAVPILMYHGVRVKGELGTNTTRENFIKQMEMLKREGYETISVHEYDLFREGTFILPPKPVIITFDDGRKDSYYTVDEILRKLGFKATIFIATNKPNENDPFFLSWDELKDVQKTKRWEIEAHGQHSHDEVVVDEKGLKGRYLTSRIFDQATGLESVDDFEKRVRLDYENGIKDLQDHLGINSRYYAVPLNDYGNVEDSNYDKALGFNKELTKQYFRLAFIEALDENRRVLETFYNYKDSDPFGLKRLEVKNMTDEDLKFALNKYSPRKPDVVFPVVQGEDDPSSNMQQLYGNFVASPTELVISTSATSTAARALFGDRGWQNYTLQAQVTRGDAREASIVLYYLDEDNLVLLDWDEHSIQLTERIDGQNTNIVDRTPLTTNDSNVLVSATIKDGKISVLFDGVQLVSDHTIHVSRGAAGFGVWDPNGGEVKVTSLLIKSTE